MTTVLVVDASVLVVALSDDGPDGDHARARLRGERLAAPELIDLEVGSVLRRKPRRGPLTSAASVWLFKISLRCPCSGRGTSACSTAAGSCARI